MTASAGSQPCRAARRSTIHSSPSRPVCRSGLRIARRSSSAAHDARAESTARAGGEAATLDAVGHRAGECVELPVEPRVGRADLGGLCVPPRRSVRVSISTRGVMRSGVVGEDPHADPGPPGSVKISTRGSPATRSTAGSPASMRLSNRSQLRCRSPVAYVSLHLAPGRGNEHRLVRGDRGLLDRALPLRPEHVVWSGSRGHRSPRLPQIPYVSLSAYTALVTLITRRAVPRESMSSARTCGGTFR